MVDFLTCVSVSFFELEILENNSPVDVNQLHLVGAKVAERAQRVVGMLELLSLHGFTLISKNHEIHAYSRTMDTQQVKDLLIKEGYADLSWNVHLEYSRRWGIL